MSPQPSSDAPRLTPIDALILDATGRAATLQFVGARPFSASDPCSAAYDASTSVVGGVLEVALVKRRHPGLAPGEGCDAMGYGRTLEIVLDPPFTGSVWHDRYGYLHFLSPPDGIFGLTALPSGWALRAERDVEGSPTGRWERTYSPDIVPDDRTRTLVLIQSLGGPVNVTAGDDRPTRVKVNGEDAILYRWPPSGELLIVWTIGTVQLALGGYESRFSVDDLAAVAGSARRPGE